MKKVAETLRGRLPRRGDDTGSMLGALMFAVIVAAVLATASLASIQVSRAHAASEQAGVALLAVGDRVQITLDDINTHRDRPLMDRIDLSKRCAEGGLCTTVKATLAPTGQVYLLATGITASGATATRQAVLRQLPTSGIVTGVDKDGRLQFVEDGGTGTDLWELITEDGQQP